MAALVFVPEGVLTRDSGWHVEMGSTCPGQPELGAAIDGGPGQFHEELQLEMKKSLMDLANDAYTVSGGRDLASGMALALLW